MTFSSFHAAARAFVVFAACCAIPAHAALNSAQRVAAFAKLPDWAGLWEEYYTNASGFPVGPAGLPDITVVGFKMAGMHPPYNKEWETRFQTALVATDRPQRDEPCTFGFPLLMVGSAQIFQLIVTPEETTMIFSQRETRHVYTDRRKHSPADEIFATPWGDSIGHWDGQTLVVDTIAANTMMMVAIDDKNVAAGPLSDQAHFIERIRMTDKDTLENQITIEDPVAFTRPWTFTRRYHRIPNMSRMVVQTCTGNDRNPVVDGKLIIAPPQ